MTNLKPGDKVLCLDSARIGNNSIMQNGIYTVRDVYEGLFITLVEYPYIRLGASRFRLLEQTDVVPSTVFTTGSKVLCLNPMGRLLCNGIYTIRAMDVLTAGGPFVELEELPNKLYASNRFKAMESLTTLSSPESTYLSENLPNVRSNNDPIDESDC